MLGAWPRRRRSPHADRSLPRAPPLAQAASDAQLETMTRDDALLLAAAVALGASIGIAYAHWHG
jgi:hypothetical protein